MRDWSSNSLTKMSEYKMLATTTLRQKIFFFLIREDQFLHSVSDIPDIFIVSVSNVKLANLAQTPLLSEQTIFLVRTAHNIVTRTAGALNNFQESLRSRLKICQNEYNLLKFTRQFEPVSSIIFWFGFLCLIA